MRKAYNDHELPLSIDFLSLTPITDAVLLNLCRSVFRKKLILLSRIFAWAIVPTVALRPEETWGRLMLQGQQQKVVVVCQTAENTR